MEGIAIRRLVAADAAAWWSLRLRTLREHPEAFGSDYDEARTRPLEEATGFLHPAPDAADDLVLGAFMGGAIVGTIGFRRERGTKVRHKGAIWGVYVAPAGRGQGLGRALLDATIARARAQSGMEQIVLTVVTENEAAAALYRSCGFVAYGTELRALRVEGRYYDETLFALKLP